MEVNIVHHRIPMSHRIAMRDQQSKPILRVRSGIILQTLLLEHSILEKTSTRSQNEALDHGTLQIQQNQLQ